jgi:hypothetical protein
MRRHPMVSMLAMAEAMVERDDALELLAYLELRRPPHERARAARERQARGLPTAPTVPTRGLCRGDHGVGVHEVLAPAERADAR